MKKERKEEILDTFEKMAAQFGLDKITMRDIAEEVGISVGSIYLDFENKEALLEAIEQRWIKHANQDFNGVLESDNTIKEKMYKLTAGHVIMFNKLINTNRGMQELMKGTLRIKYIRKKMGSHRDVIKKLMAKKISKLLKEGILKNIFTTTNVGTTANVIINAFGEYLSTDYLIDRDAEIVKKDADEMFTFIWKAIRK